MVVERVDGRPDLEAVLGAGAASGAWLGLFVGLLLSLSHGRYRSAADSDRPGRRCGFGLASLAVRYVATKEQRDFVLHSQLVARRYDVLCQSRTAEHGRDLLAALAMKAPLTV